MVKVEMVRFFFMYVTWAFLAKSLHGEWGKFEHLGKCSFFLTPHSPEVDQQHRAAKALQIHVDYLNVIAVQALTYYECCVIASTTLDATSGHQIMI